MKFIIAAIAMGVWFLIAWSISLDRKKIKSKMKPIIFLLVVQFILAFVFLNTTFGEAIILKVAAGVQVLFDSASVGVDFVFGGLKNEGVANQFFLNVLMPMVFISGLVGILNHIKVLPFFINLIGSLLSKVNGLGRLESYNVVAYPFISSGAFISFKDKFATMSNARLFSICLGTISNFGVTVVAAYMQMLSPKYVVIALIMNMIGIFIMSLVVSPFDVDPKDDVFEVADDEENKKPFFTVLGDYMTLGFNIAISIAIMAMGFIGLITLINTIFQGTIGITFQQILGYLFAPFAFLMGVSGDHIVQVGEIMATKLLSNEFVGIQSFTQIAETFSERSVAIVSIFCLSFANFAGMGITVGLVGSFDKAKGAVVAKYSLRIMLASTLISMMNATIIGLFI